MEAAERCVKILSMTGAGGAGPAPPSTGPPPTHTRQVAVQRNQRPGLSVRQYAAESQQRAKAAGLKAAQGGLKSRLAQGGMRSTQQKPGGLPGLAGTTTRGAAPARTAPGLIA